MPVTMVVLPTYNEAENLPLIIEALFELPVDDLQVLVVDDSSPDGTGDLAEKLALELGISIPDYAEELFAAKSDVSAFSDAALLRMDSKEYTVEGKELRVSVLETTAPKVLLDRKASLMAAMEGVAKEDGADQVLLFVIDILREEATLLVPNDLVKTIAEKSFGASVTGDTVVLPGVMSRKKQIIPALTL